MATEEPSYEAASCVPHHAVCVRVCVCVLPVAANGARAAHDRGHAHGMALARRNAGRGYVREACTGDGGISDLANTNCESCSRNIQDQQHAAATSDGHI